MRINAPPLDRITSLLPPYETVDRAAAFDELDLDARRHDGAQQTIAGAFEKPTPREILGIHEEKPGLTPFNEDSACDDLPCRQAPGTIERLFAELTERLRHPEDRDADDERNVQTGSECVI